MLLFLFRLGGREEGGGGVARKAEQGYRSRCFFFFFLRERESGKAFKNMEKKSLALSFPLSVLHLTSCPLSASSTAASTMRRSAPVFLNSARVNREREKERVSILVRSMAARSRVSVGINFLLLDNSAPPSPRSGWQKAMRRGRVRDDEEDRRGAPMAVIFEERNETRFFLFSRD